MDTRDSWSGAIWAGMAVFVTASAVRLGIGTPSDPGPGFLPLGSGLALGLLAVILPVARGLGRNGAAPGEERPSLLPGRSAVAAVLALSLYCWILPVLGYLVATTGLMLALFALGRMKSRTVVSGSLLAALLSYVLFHHVLKVPLPRGILDF